MIRTKLFLENMKLCSLQSGDGGSDCRLLFVLTNLIEPVESLNHDRV